MDRQSILTAFPGNDAKTQCKRIEAALRHVGPLTTIEARKDLDVMMPATRVHELRHAHGLNIITTRVDRQTDAGHTHRVAVYTLHPGKWRKA
ncbi:helix-turn-helix domain-containing protein [Robbsia sp. Bb-Pol-6]|uniref:Helix-turn-helix domain-containing protein n=1 Tax=Robbsia betulipollinis TaxID=2981849 RepID=A0ABT3ZNX0_9BURK|nr:helix-turn-helix domain-containing protein [Robbsia betulipollinis]MCY0388243.1 helix-turn-helix domain-containing protein [Robbsia betulipollinis]